MTTTQNALHNARAQAFRFRLEKATHQLRRQLSRFALDGLDSEAIAIIRNLESAQLEGIRDAGLARALITVCYHWFRGSEAPETIASVLCPELPHVAERCETTLPSFQEVAERVIAEAPHHFPFHALARFDDKRGQTRLTGVLAGGAEILAKGNLEYLASRAKQMYLQQQRDIDADCPVQLNVPPSPELGVEPVDISSALYLLNIARKDLALLYGETDRLQQVWNAAQAGHLESQAILLTLVDRIGLLGRVTSFNALGMLSASAGEQVRLATYRACGRFDLIEQSKDDQPDPLLDLFPIEVLQNSNVYQEICDLHARTSYAFHTPATRASLRTVPGSSEHLKAAEKARTEALLKIERESQAAMFKKLDQITQQYRDLAERLGSITKLTEEVAVLNDNVAKAGRAGQ